MSDVLSPINVFGIGEVRTHTTVLAVDMDVPARDWWRRCGEGTPRGQGQNTDRGQNPRGRQAFATNHHFGPSHTEPLDDRSQISLALSVATFASRVGATIAKSRIPLTTIGQLASRCPNVLVNETTDAIDPDDSGCIRFAPPPDPITLTKPIPIA